MGRAPGLSGSTDRAGMPGVDAARLDRHAAPQVSTHTLNHPAIMSNPTETPPPAAATPPPAAATGEDRTVAILSYLTIIGFIVALIMHSSKKTALGSFHLRQCLGLIITAIALSIAGMILMFIPFIGWLTAMACWIGMLVLWVMGLIAAVNGQQKPLPVVGEHYQKWFSGAFT